MIIHGSDNQLILGNLNRNIIGTDQSDVFSKRDLDNGSKYVDGGLGDDVFPAGDDFLTGGDGSDIFFNKYGSYGRCKPSWNCG